MTDRFPRKEDLETWISMQVFWEVGSKTECRSWEQLAITGSAWAGPTESGQRTLLCCRQSPGRS